MDYILKEGRVEISGKTEELMQGILDSYQSGIELTTVNLQDSQPPDPVQAAFDDAIAAQEDEIRFLREAEAYARGIEPRARGRVKRMEQEALAYKQQTVLDAQGEVAKFNKLLPEYHAAPEVTRQRMYLTTMESVYANTSKVMVDVEGGNNMMYLPLDKMMQNQSSIQRTLPQSQSRINQPINTSSSAPAMSGRADRFNSGRN